MRLLDPLEHYKTLATKGDPRTVHVFQKNDDIQVEILRFGLQTFLQQR
jgi:hypothetical protein